MPGSWDPQVYWDRAQQWLEAATALPPGPTKEAYVVISDGYAKLAELIERDNANQT
jgi:hypothetical protein